MAQIEVLSEITGVVYEVEVKPGDKVEEGDSLLLIEAMKMEIPVLATEDGTVAKILVAEKDAVTEGQPLVVLDT
ncbi:MAG: acetyl-CoA carboxylase biotin carboxyl carrier protein subunit [bacterium]